MRDTVICRSAPDYITKQEGGFWKVYLNEMAAFLFERSHFSRC